LPGASGTCTTNQAATACDCTINVVTDLAATASYTATAGSVTSGVGNFEYCVEAGKFTQTFGDATKIHGLFTATKL
jgi:hypothetical protein